MTELCLIKHPVTQKLYNMKQAADIIGIHVSTLYGRIKHGDTGEHLWRPRETRINTSILPSNKVSVTGTQVLNQIPSETRFDKKFA